MYGVGCCTSSMFQLEWNRLRVQRILSNNKINTNMTQVYAREATYTESLFVEFKNPQHAQVQPGPWSGLILGVRDSKKVDP